MFSKLFKKSKPVKTLSKPADLQVGDMLQLIDSFALPPELKGATLTVTQVNTYEYEYENEFEFVLKGPGQRSIFMTIENDDGEEWANFSIKIERKDVDEIFTLEQFAHIFDDEDLTEIDTKQVPEKFERWLDDSYKQCSEVYKGYYHEQDFRGRAIQTYAGDGSEPFEAFSLMSSEEDYFVHIEIWPDGDTDVSLMICRPVSDIVDLFPGDPR
ncbi:hypothetical protein [Algicola sagamiensis]|uniref:hypothetical protein n=1 Tax=Algicola sagamiensis TaxID=163869 RepID=UPI00037DFF94|nr:hypothetical protein [Algicola sagamiensis]